MEKIIKVNKINSEQQNLKEGRETNSDSRICPVVKKGDVFIFDFSFINDSEKKRVLLFSIHRKGERIRLKGDDKLFLGTFSNKNDIKSLLMQLIIFLEVILGIRMSISTKDDKVIAII